MRRRRPRATCCWAVVLALGSPVAAAEQAGGDLPRLVDGFDAAGGRSRAARPNPLRRFERSNGTLVAGPRPPAGSGGGTCPASPGAPLQSAWRARPDLRKLGLAPPHCGRLRRRRRSRSSSAPPTPSAARRPAPDDHLAGADRFQRLAVFSPAETNWIAVAADLVPVALRLDSRTFPMTDQRDAWRAAAAACAGRHRNARAGGQEARGGTARRRWQRCGR